jgi:hypothetical protein
VVNNEINPECGTSGGADTLDKIFLLSISETKKYFNSDEARVAYYLDSDLWWLRSPGDISGNAANVGRVGVIDVYGIFVNHVVHGGVRPALWLNL